MNQKIKLRVIALAAALLVAGVLAACGRKADTAAQTTAAQTTAEQNTAAQTTAAQTAVAETKVAEQTQEAPAQKQEIHIVYTNDIHSYIYNETTDKDKNKKPGLRLSNVAAMKQDLKKEGKNVLLLDAGDEIQGNIYGARDKGQTVIRLMNMAGYDAATLGNHEFDYDIETLFDRVAEADYPFLSCTFRSVKDNELVMDSSEIFDLNGTKVAVIGITTPETLSSTAPTKFKDADGNFLYTFSGAEDPEELYAAVQTAVDEVKDKADYVIAIAHLGIDHASEGKKVDSRNVIANTEGIDAVIDGHSHTVVLKEMVKNKKGEEIVLTQTGAYLANIGHMTIRPDGTIDTELIPEYASAEPKLQAEEDTVHDKLYAELGQKIAHMASKQYVTQADSPATRIIRAMETNLGDMVPDAFYWYINETAGMHCDAVIQNGGGIRAELETGDISYLDAKNVCPFDNQICLIEVTGQQLIDILENGAKEIGKWDELNAAPAENGSFMHVAGMKYTIDAAVPSGIVSDANDQFQSVDGAYRVKDVQIYNRETASYEPVDQQRTYALGGINYMLRNGGSGLGFLRENKVIVDYLGPDVELFVEYLKNFEKEGEYPEVCTKNSPLADWKNYLMDYENPLGAGRISQINLNYEK